MSAEDKEELQATGSLPDPQQVSRAAAIKPYVGRFLMFKEELFNRVHIE